MKQILFFTIAMLLLMHTEAFSQPEKKPSREEMITNIISSLNKELSLTNDQESTIKNALIEFFDEMDKMHDNSERPDMSAIKELETERDNKIQKVLSDEQYEIYLSVMEKSQPKKGGPSQHPH